MIKNKISPIYFQHDLLNTEMPAAFFDPTAKTPMYFYHLNNESEIDADNLFIDEDNNVQHTFEMTFYGTVDCWFATNISKFVQPFHSDSLAKTMAYQTELKCYIDDIKIFDKINLDNNELYESFKCSDSENIDDSGLFIDYYWERGLSTLIAKIIETSRQNVDKHILSGRIKDSRNIDYTILSMLGEELC